MTSGEFTSGKIWDEDDSKYPYPPVVQEIEDPNRIPPFADHPVDDQDLRIVLGEE